MPLLPLAIALMGIYRWRGVCPLATIAAAGRLTRSRRTVPAWLEAHSLLVTFGALLALLVANRATEEYRNTPGTSPRQGA